MGDRFKWQIIKNKIRVEKGIHKNGFDSYNEHNKGIQ